MRVLVSTLMMVILGYSTITAQFKVGAGNQVIFQDFVIGPQVKIVYDSDQLWRVAGTFTYHLKKNYDWTIDLDGQYKLITLGKNFDVYPQVGIGYTNLVARNVVNLNAGFFFEFPITDFNFYIEPKYLIKKGKSFAIAAGLLF